MLPREDEDGQLACHGDAPAGAARPACPGGFRGGSRQIPGPGAESEELRGDGRPGGSRRAFAATSLSRSGTRGPVCPLSFSRCSFLHRRSTACPRRCATNSSNPDTGMDEGKKPETQFSPAADAAARRSGYVCPARCAPVSGLGARSASCAREDGGAGEDARFAVPQSRPRVRPPFLLTFLREVWGDSWLHFRAAGVVPDGGLRAIGVQGALALLPL